MNNLDQHFFTTLQQEWQETFGYGSKCLLLLKDLKAHFSNAQVDIILRILDNICWDCWNHDRPCHCCNDE